MADPPNVTNLELLLAGMLGMFLLALGVVFFFLAYQRRLFRQQQAHQQKEAAYQQQLLRASLLSQEKERNRIGKDLHDEVGALLTTSKLYFRHLDPEAAPEKFAGLKAKVMDLLEETITSVRRVSHDLRPVVLERLGLAEAITNMADELDEAGEVAVHFKNDWQGIIDKEYELNWFRIVRELLNNTLKHARATEIEIHLSGGHDRLNMTYRDNGLGLGPGKQAGKGLGMQNIESRLNLMQGTLQYREKKEPGICLDMTSATRPDAEIEEQAASVDPDEVRLKH